MFTRKNSKDFQYAPNATKSGKRNNIIRSDTMVKTVPKNFNCCALCRNYNNGWGATSVKAVGRTMVSFESTEKHQCMINGMAREAWLKCENFSPRF